MKKILSAALLALACSTQIFAQDAEVKQFVKQGIELHDNGDYKGAIALYQQALKLDSKSPMVNYEIASSYFESKNYAKAMEHINVVLASNSNLMDQAFILKGSVLDLQGKKKEAIDVYESAIRQYKDNYLLYYNLALTLTNSKGDEEKITNALQQALKLNPTHASSHLLLGLTMMNEGKRVQSLLALYNFMLLEPKSSRSENALIIIMEQLKQGVEKKDSTTIKVLVSPPDKNDAFSAVDMMLSMQQAYNVGEESKDKSEHELFIKTTESFLSILTELKKDNKGFWWDFYVDFYSSMKENNNVTTFCYYIWQVKNNVKVNRWLQDNPSKITRFSKWYNSYLEKL
jgi:tetratricopeptide (TPR) repeat protein